MIMLQISFYFQKNNQGVFWGGAEGILFWRAQYQLCEWDFIFNGEKIAPLGLAFCFVTGPNKIDLSQLTFTSGQAA